MQSFLLEQQTKRYQEQANTAQIRFNQKQNNQRIQNSFARVEKFALTDRNQDIFKTLNDGTISLQNPQFHNFRDRDKQLEKDEKGILVQNYQTSKDRAQQTETFIKTQILDRLQYQKNLNTDYLRVRQKEKEGQILKFGTEKLQEERINNIIQQNQMIDYSEKEMRKTHFPIFRDANQKQWISTQMSFNKKDQVWKSPEYTPYDKFQEIKLEQDFLIKRDKKKEQGRFEFISTISSGQIDNAEFNQKSIRSQFQDKALNINENQYTFSKNKKLEGFYKKALLTTGSLDNNFPFQHSTNKRGKNLRDLRPKNNKIYKNSIKDQINNYKQKQDQNNQQSIKKNQDQNSQQFNQTNTTIKERSFQRKSQGFARDDQKIIEKYFCQFE